MEIEKFSTFFPKKYNLLKEQLAKCENLFNEIKDLKDNDKRKFQGLQKIISVIEVNPKFNYEFLRILKENGIQYDEGGEIWDYNKNFDLLEKTLISTDYFSLTNKEKENSLKQLINMLKILAEKTDNDFSSDIYQPIKLEFNFPFIEGISSLRIEYYINYILSSPYKENIKEIKEYIQNIELDPEIMNLNIDNSDFELKLYLLIVHLAENISNNFDFTNDYFLKDIKEEIIPSNKYLIDLKNNSCLIKNKAENNLINPKDYMLGSLLNDIQNNPKYPLKTLLFRNQSFQKFKRDGGFLKQLGLYESFINYLKEFIKSECIQELLSSSEYKNIQPLLNDDKYLDEILDEKHLKFIPFICSRNKFGYTNKDFVLSIININPYIVDFPSKFLEKPDFRDKLYFLSIFCSLGILFITCLQEIIIHLTFGYLEYLSEKSITSDSPKTKLNSIDGGFAFEEKLTGINKFSFLSLHMIITLFDGISCHNDLKTFQEKLSKKEDVSKIDGKLLKNGFLTVLEEKLGINFEELIKIPDINLMNIKCRADNEIIVSMDNRENCSRIKGGIFEI